jgi:hypothetical protein
MEGALPACWPPRRLPGHRRADEHRLRREPRRHRAAADDVKLVASGVSVVNIDNGLGGGYTGLSSHSRRISGDAASENKDTVPISEAHHP